MRKTIKYLIEYPDGHRRARVPKGADQPIHTFKDQLKKVFSSGFLGVPDESSINNYDYNNPQINWEIRVSYDDQLSDSEQVTKIDSFMDIDMEYVIEQKNRLLKAIAASRDSATQTGKIYHEALKYFSFDWNNHKNYYTDSDGNISIINWGFSKIDGGIYITLPGPIESEYEATLHGDGTYKIRGTGEKEGEKKTFTNEEEFDQWLRETFGPREEKCGICDADPCECPGEDACEKCGKDPCECKASLWERFLIWWRGDGDTSKTTWDWADLRSCLFWLFMAIMLYILIITIIGPDKHELDVNEDGSVTYQDAEIAEREGNYREARLIRTYLERREIIRDPVIATDEDECQKKGWIDECGVCIIHGKKNPKWNKSCTGCMEYGAWNYNPDAKFPGICYFVSPNDTDGDGIGNETDTDLDGDGIPNSQDSDDDNDGISDDIDSDDDNNGINDENETSNYPGWEGSNLTEEDCTKMEWFDQCGVCHINGAKNLGWDLSCTGCMDENSSNYNIDAKIPCESCCFADDKEDENDLDDDGRNNYIDNDIDGDGEPNSMDLDDDNDGIPDIYDHDDDNNGLNDEDELATYPGSNQDNYDGEDTSTSDTTNNIDIATVDWGKLLTEIQSTLYKHSQANKFYNENKNISVDRYTLNYTFDEGYAKDWSTRITYELDEEIDEYIAVGDTIFVSPEGDRYLGINSFQEELNNRQ